MPTQTLAIQAAIFDCDGLLADTETPDYDAWQAIYAEHGLALPVEEWAATIGIAKGHDIADKHTPLARVVGSAYNADAIDAHRRALYHEAMQHLVPLPGVVPLLDLLDAHGIPAAVASNSERPWVDTVLRTVGLAGRFRAIATADEVVNPKPAPDVYLLAARRLGVPPARCIAFEDSPRGLAATHAAGMVSVAVPSALTRHMDWAQAHAVLPSLSAATEEWLAHAAQLNVPYVAHS